MKNRLNGIIDALETGTHVFGTISAPDISAAVTLSTSDYDAVILDAEHRPWDVNGIRDSLQYLINRRRVFESDNLRPSVTPLVRIPSNGGEFSQWHAKQALDMGAYGIVWPHINTVTEARNAVAACRYPRGSNAGLHEPKGLRGDGPYAAAHYWGINVAEYYERADVWPLNPEGELIVCIMIESLMGVENLPSILDEVPGIGLVLTGPADLSQELGVPGQHQHPDVLECQSRVLEICLERGIAVAHANVTPNNAEEVVNAGYRLLLSSPKEIDLGKDAARRVITEREKND